MRRVFGDSAAQPLFIETIRKRGYRTIAEVSGIGPAALPGAGSWLTDSPFRGLQAFDAEHAAVFFGRAALTAALAEALCAQVQAGRALQPVLGPSGSGKSSIIGAGLLPALAQGGYGLQVHDSATIDVGELQAGQLFAGLGGAMLDWQLPQQGAALFSGFSACLLGQLPESDAGAVVALPEQALGQCAGAARLVLVIDRFEALFTQPYVSAEQRQSLVRALDTLARSGRVVVVMACRNDFYPRIAEFPALLEGKAGGAHFDLVPPSHADIAQIVTLPANLTFGTDPHSGKRLDVVLCRATAISPDALPLLQYTLHELYRLRSADGELGVEAYRQLGGLDGVLGARAEQVVLALGPALIAALALLACTAGVSALHDKQFAQQLCGEAEGLMGFMLSDFADKLRPLARLDLLDGVSAEALEYLAVSDDAALSAASLTYRAKALQVIGEVRIARGDSKAALEALQGAQTILERQLRAAPRDAELLKQIGANAFWLGKLQLDQGAWAPAQVFLAPYRDYADRFSALDPADVDAWIEQSYAHNSLGSLALKRGDTRAAAEFDLSIALKNHALVRKPQDQMLAQDLADSLSWAGSANEVMGRLDGAEALYGRQLQLAQALHDGAPGGALWSDKLAEALQHQARLNVMRGDARTALVQYRRAAALLQANMASAPGNRPWQANAGLVQLALLRFLPSDNLSHVTVLRFLAYLFNQKAGKPCLFIVAALGAGAPPSV